MRPACTYRGWRTVFGTEAGKETEDTLLMEQFQASYKGGDEIIDDCWRLNLREVAKAL